MMSDTGVVIEFGKQYNETTASDANARYKSWEHCYNAFASYKSQQINKEDVDNLCLHLAFYLASWGMYRGSSFLLQKDYRIHASIIRTIMQKKYLHLWAISCDDYIQGSEYVASLMSLSNELYSIYGDIRESVYTFTDKHSPVQAVSSTLITKVLLGTLGCVPAYDSFFSRGITAFKVASSIYGEKSIISLSAYYNKNKEAFEDLRTAISSKGIVYPQMKILDMCFWQAGYNIKQRR